MVRLLPLRNGFFSAPHISETEEVELLTWARTLVPSLNSPDSEWAFSHEKKGITVSEDRQKGGLFYSIRGVGAVQASLEDVMDMMIATNTSEFRSMMKLLLKDMSLDSAVIYQRDQNDSESLSIKWFALKNKAAMATSQDFCVLEYAGILSADYIGGDPNKLVGVCLYESIDQSECPSLFDSHRLERGSISKCGYLFRPTDELGTLEAQFICSIRQPPGIRTTRRSNRAMLQYWAESLSNIQESVHTRRISRLLTQRETPTWVSDHERQCCHLCLKSFTGIRRKHHCRACGEVICKKCSIINSVDLPPIGLTTMRICKSCSDGNLITASAQAADDQGAPEPLSRRGSALDPRFSSSMHANELALTIPSSKSSVPDSVGMAWLSQIAARDPTKREMVEKLMEGFGLQEEGIFEASSGEYNPNAPPEDIYDLLCDLASQALDCKFAIVHILDENRQWFKSKVTIKESDIGRDFSFCEVPVATRMPVVVLDTWKDGRFETNPFVTGPLQVRFLAGAPLFDVDGSCVGSVCVLDSKPRVSLPPTQLALMEKLAHLAMVSLQERREAIAKKQLLILPRPQSVSYESAKPFMLGQVPYNAQRASDLVPLQSSYTKTAPSASQAAAMQEQKKMQEQMLELLHQSSLTQQQLKTTVSRQDAGLPSSGERSV
ncbi:hypothetical protein SPRG_08748 [Saprolegnia parasitica CBS 223.65]|uniref:FYVE-type domain-containing protein n=1 Tax=Saprolegnia parasitica (strain CBS 223.65) TaxID=695850 RepID=A0A067C9G8_SAPPC|nr:hypothetical protein SPRG_08748 [Saprolegnia parasitica CBS 223.65]KDO25805.1 hypothetical protein SPRG_08748 [Saprolegnia parasitica CBS 223.65]|eukprot:XP_012203370.1 hypothetical protein SPRG_08748 [Saprolegnia parasitica CBS 223.65]